MGQDETSLQEVQDLLKEALAGPLLPTQQQQVLIFHLTPPNPIPTKARPQLSLLTPSGECSSELSTSQVLWQLHSVL